LLPYDADRSPLPTGSYTFAGNPTGPNCGAAGQTCKLFLCGQPIVAKAPLSALRDWWICAGPGCDTAGAGSAWSEACRDSNICTITMADQDLYVVSIPDALRDAVQADPNGSLSWMVRNGGI
jgi:hypothetical protein